MKLIKKRISIFFKVLTLINYFSKRLYFSNKERKKQIIICFDGNFPHGGLVDRFKGIISFYEISKILNFDFKLFFNHPFELKNFLLPNKVDWKINDNELNYFVFSTKILYLMNDFKANPLEVIKKTKAKTIIVYCNVDYLPLLYIDKNEEELNRIWRKNFLELFKISNFLKEKLEKHSKQSRIVFHTRFTTLMGDFKDTTKLVLDETEKYDLIQKVVKRIDEIAILHLNKNIYVLSDSELFLKYIQINTNYKTLEGIPKHIENSNHDIKFHSKTFLDFYFLIESNEVFFIRIDNMYNSGFSKYASIIGDKKYITLS